MLGKLCTCLSDESFRAGLLLCNWHKAGLLPELEGIAQCLMDDVAPAAKAKQAKQHQQPMGHMPRKKARTDMGSSDCIV